MPQIRYLKIRFNQDISVRDIPKFRAAIIEKTERVSSLFHNHASDTQVMYRYPLIQYKITENKASIVCLQSGTDDIHFLLQQKEMNLRIGAKKSDFEIEDVDLHYDTVEIKDTTTSYTLHNWLALNQKHYAQWRACANDEKAQGEMLSRILRGNILSFAKGLDWWIEGRVEVEVTAVKAIKTRRFKQNEVLTFTVEFRTNVSLPEFVGLGKGVSVGFGVLEKNKIENNKI